MIHILTNTYQVLDPWFGGAHRDIELDMGCGKGGFTLDLATRFPERLVLGSDVMIGRLRRVEKKIVRRGLDNIELLRAVNLELAGFQLPDGCIGRVHLLCPDPWPKARHRGKRLATTDFLGKLARILRPGGVLHVATDHAPYFTEFQHVLERHPAFVPAPEGLADIADLKTDFELLWEREGRHVPHLAYRTTNDG